VARLAHPAAADDETDELYVLIEPASPASEGSRRSSSIVIAQLYSRDPLCADGRADALAARGAQHLSSTGTAAA
jgi:hypothetical protein